MNFISPMMWFFVVYPFLSIFLFGIIGTLMFKKHALWLMPAAVLLSLLVFMLYFEAFGLDFVIWLVLFPLLTLLSGALTYWMRH